MCVCVSVCVCVCVNLLIRPVTVLTWGRMYEERIPLKPDNPTSRLAKRLKSPALGSHARLVSLLLNRYSLVFGF